MAPDQPVEIVDISDLDGFSQWWDLKRQEVAECVEQVTQGLEFRAVSTGGLGGSESDWEDVRCHLEATRLFLDEISLAMSTARQSNSSGVTTLNRIKTEAESQRVQIESLLGQLAQLEATAAVSMATKPRKLFTQTTYEPLPTGAPFISSIQSQIRKDLWSQDEDGIAVFTKVGKSNPSNYIEHYISSPGDVSMLPWDQAEEIINKFGFTTVKLQLILAAYAMSQPEPWSGSFSVSGADLIRDLGWDARKDVPMGRKLAELAGAALALDCLLVKVEWDEGSQKRGRVRVTIQTSRMWNISVTATGQRNLLTERLDDIEKLELQVQPGLWTKGFLNKGGARARDALYQFGYLGQSVLKIDPYHDEVALRLAIHLTLESRIHKSGEYRLITLLQSILPGWDARIAAARDNRFKSRDLVDQWNRALATLISLGWSVTFDNQYPESLKPGSQQRKPKGYLDIFLESKLTIKPPAPIPELLNGDRGPKVQKKPASISPVLPVASLTGKQIREARKTKGWSQAKLAGIAGISQQLVSHLESGRRDITPQIEARLRTVLKLDV